MGRVYETTNDRIDREVNALLQEYFDANGANQVMFISVALTADGLARGVNRFITENPGITKVAAGYDEYVAYVSDRVVRTLNEAMELLEND